MTVDEDMGNMQQADRSSKRQCHICGKTNVDRWCHRCMLKFGGKNRILPKDMSPGEKASEIELLLSAPYELPMFAIFARIKELSGRDLSPEDFFGWERINEAKHPNALFRPLQKTPQQPPPLPPPPSVVPETTQPERPSRTQSFAHADPAAETMAAMPAVGNEVMPTRAYPIIPEAVPLDAYPGRSGGTPAALAPPLPPPLPPAVSLRLRRNK